MNTCDARTLLKMMADVGAISMTQHRLIKNKLNEMDAAEARHNMALDNDPEIFG